MAKKYVLTEETIAIGAVTLHRIKAAKDFHNVKKGELGGYVENESNLSHDGSAWVYEDAGVYGNARVYGEAGVKK